MATCFMVDGFGWSGMMPTLQIVKDYQAAGYALEQVPYNNLINTTANINTAADTLQTYLTNPAYTPPFVVVTISMGGCVAAMLLRRWALLAGGVGPVAPADLEFILLANPERKYNGGAVLRASVFGLPFLSRYAEPPGVPPNTHYRVTDFSRQYDGVSDWPNLPNPSWDAISNCLLGLVVVHDFYFAVTLHDTANLTLAEGNITYVLSPTFPVNSALWAAGNHPLAAALDAQLRPKIEASYRRPFGVTTPLPPPGQQTGLAGGAPSWLPHGVAHCLGSRLTSTSTPTTPTQGFQREGTCPVCGKLLALIANTNQLADHRASWHIADLP